jgi:asparagine N-glycosylation enzyme membrane subunit Stt3
MNEEDEFTFDFSAGKKKKEQVKDKKESEQNEEPEFNEEAQEEKHQKKKEEHKTHHHKEEHHKKETKEVKEKDEEFTFDFKSILKVVDKYKHFLIPLVLILICLYAGIHYRSYPNTLPVTDNWAQDTVVNYYKSNIRAQIDQQYPNLPEANKNSLVETQYTEFYKQNKENIEAQVNQVSQNFKDQFKDDKGYTYLGDIDSYFWMRYAENIIEQGTYGDEIKDGRDWDTYMLAPVGSEANPSLYPYIEAINYKIMHFFNQNITLMQTVFYVPIILSLIAVVAAFFIAKKIGGYLGGFIAAFLVAIHPMILSRTFGSDNDILNIFFPLVILWLFLEAFETKNKVKGIVISALDGFIIGLYSFAWGGWWFIFLFMIAACGFYILYYVILDYKEIKKSPIKYLKHSDIANVAIILGTIVVFSTIFVSMFTGISTMSDVLFYPINFLTIKAASHADLWPNVYTTVAELNEASWDQIIGNIGGRLFFFISVLGIILTVIKKDEKGKRDIKFAVFLLIWYFATIFASLKGVRFVMLLVPAVCIAIGAGMGIIYQYLERWLSKTLEISKIITRTILIALFLLILLQPMKMAESSAINEVPIMNDAWYNSLNLIKQNSTQEAIINSWWDFGHHFKYVADRRVTADGASQNRPQAHWIGKVLLTSNEKEAIGILRMLDCSSDIVAFEAINKNINDTSKSIQILSKIILLDSASAKKVLKGYMSEEDASNIVDNYTHCAPPEDYFITSEDMVGKAGVWAHFGSWNFNRAEIWVNVKEMNKDDAVKFMLANKDYNLTKEQAEKVYFEVQALKDEQEANAWIAPWPGYASGLTPCTEEKKSDDVMLKCSNGILVNMTSKEFLIPTSEGIKLAKRVGYLEGEKYIIKDFDNNTMELGGDIIKKGNDYYVIINSPELTGSMFTRLFYGEGEGLKYFDRFSDVRDVTGARIIVWKVDWNGK